jgi:hypothetical protein
MMGIKCKIGSFGKLAIVLLNYVFDKLFQCFALTLLRGMNLSKISV